MQWAEVHYTFRLLESSPPNEPLMADQIVITEKTSQAKDIRAAVGSRYGDILPAEGPQKKAKLPDRLMKDAYDDLASLKGMQFVAETA